jgi:hypothetical protein
MTRVIESQAARRKPRAAGSADMSTPEPRPVFVLKIEFVGKAEFAIHGLRKLLKSLIRGHHFRVLSIEEIEGQQ